MKEKNCWSYRFHKQDNPMDKLYKSNSPKKLEKVPCEACIPPAYSHTPRPKKLDVLDLEL